eukprot:maker-scaffold532_size145644-snap-gene-0.44 protein:Tk04532 transcript:maker-scaffold532_size145644-snap-gene-0.44-mRNA-1 annotation:"membrane metallo-endopeptidase-like 1-like"
MPIGSTHHPQFGKADSQLPLTSATSRNSSTKSSQFHPTGPDRAMDMEIQQVPWWNRRSQMERRFFILAVILLCLTVGLAMGLASVLYSRYEPGAKPGGPQATAAFTANPSVQTNGHHVRLLLEEENSPDEAKSFHMARDVYKSCMDKEEIEIMGLDPLKQILRDLGGWPALEGDSWDGSNYIWYEQVYRFRKMGYSVDYFVDFSVTTDLKNSSWRILDLDQPGLGMSREYLIKGFLDEDVQAYLQYMIDVATFLGAEPDFAIEEMKRVLEFEIMLANFSLPREERRNASKLYNPMRIKDVSQFDPHTPWLEYINNILTPDIIQVSEDEIIIVDVPSYLERFSTFIQTVPARVQSNYMLWRVAAASMKYLNEEARKISLKFSEKLTGKSEETPRWRTCVGAAKGSLANAVGAMYVRRYFDEASKQAALDMVGDIRAEFDDILEQVDWMDENTKRRAKQKAKGIVEHIGYPPELLDNEKLNELYAGLELNSTHYLGNALNMTVFGTNYAFSKLREMVNKTDWIRHGRPAVVNAFYSPLENSIQFPAGILQGIFFSNERPKYMNYGAIGWVIGHEITHGFDDQGRQFDMEGNLVDWWEPITKERYLRKAQCIIQQYANYTIPHLGGLGLNGINTQGENIADNGGIKEAYQAYEKWVTRSHQKEQLLPGLGRFNQHQLFWMSAANVWCAKYRDKALKLRVLTGVHSPDMFRVKGPFSNMPEFSRDFQCSLGTPMNPKKKCEVW